MKFSQRIGKIPIIKKLQIESMDLDLKNSLWNIVYYYLIGINTNLSSETDIYSDFDLFIKKIWMIFFKLPIDEAPTNKSDAIFFIKNYFFKENWYDTYDLIEYLSSSNHEYFNPETFINKINSILVQESSAYRFVDGKIIPLSNEMEIESLKNSLEKTTENNSLNGANLHLNIALEKLSDKKNPDYRNSIKESISAVESTCRILTDENTLGKALSALSKKGIEINSELKKSFDKIYSYTNQKNVGVRHAIIGTFSKPDYHDAKYILIICSAFINFLIGKCIDSNVEIKKDST